MEAVVMVMEAFQGHEGRIQYDVVGHSGESHDITFIDHKNPPTDNKRRLAIIKVSQLMYSIIITPLMFCHQGESGNVQYRHHTAHALLCPPKH
jgi:hypothetical protein